MATNSWVKTSIDIPIQKGLYLFSVHFFRNQGGGANPYYCAIAFGEGDTYSGDTHLGGIALNWTATSLGTYKVTSSVNRTLHVFVRHTSTEAHKIDVRMDVIRLGDN